MQIQITITPADLAEASEILARIGAQAAIAVTPAPVPAPEKATRTRKAKTDAEPIPEAPEYRMGGQPIAPPPAAPAPAVEDAKVVSEPAASALDYDRDVMPTLSKLAGSPETLKQVTAILAKYGVKRGREVPVERLAEFKAEIEKVGKEEAGVL